MVVLSSLGAPSAPELRVVVADRPGAPLISASKLIPSPLLILLTQERVYTCREPYANSCTLQNFSFSVGPASLNLSSNLDERAKLCSL